MTRMLDSFVPLQILDFEINRYSLLFVLHLLYIPLSFLFDIPNTTHPSLLQNCCLACPQTSWYGPIELHLYNRTLSLKLILLPNPECSVIRWAVPMSDWLSLTPALFTILFWILKGIQMIIVYRKG